jgi:hypothetical protein
MGWLTRALLQLLAVLSPGGQPARGRMGQYISVLVFCTNCTLKINNEFKNEFRW